jgi:hypothetical protein
LLRDSRKPYHLIELTEEHMRFFPCLLVAAAAFTLTAFITAALTPACPSLSLAVGALAGMFCCDVVADAKAA